MSTTIDERVVEMRFDNKQFEQNIQTSLSSLDKLKKSLNLEGAAKGLETVNNAANKCSGNMSPLSNAVETVRVRFSALEVSMRPSSMPFRQSLQIPLQKAQRLIR